MRILILHKVEFHAILNSVLRLSCTGLYACLLHHLSVMLLVEEAT